MDTVALVEFKKHEYGFKFVEDRFLQAGEPDQRRWNKPPIKWENKKKLKSQTQFKQSFCILLLEEEEKEEGCRGEGQKDEALCPNETVWSIRKTTCVHRCGGSCLDSR